MAKSFLEELRWRGLVQDTSHEQELQTLSPCTFYCGFDPTAPSLQVGNLVPFFTLTRIATFGFEPIVLFGGATGAIGDPSGKADERTLLSLEQVQQNVESQIQQMSGLMDKLGLKARFLNNADWLGSLSLQAFLRDIGKHLTVNWMLQKESVKRRVESGGISYTEFSYMLLQAYDFYHLNKEYNCKMQVGGSDQWGNITAGMELIRRKLQGEAYGVTFPLVTDSQGRKLGKTEDGAIWLDPTRTSPYQFHQYWLNREDTEAVSLLKTFSFRTREELERIEQEHQAEPHKRLAQHALADEFCDLIHGSQSTVLAKRSADVLFGGSIDGISENDLSEIFREVPSSTLARNEVGSMSFMELMTKVGLAKSKGEARRLVQNGGAYLNNTRVEDGERSMQEPSSDANMLILRSGKKKYHVVRLA